MNANTPDQHFYLAILNELKEIRKLLEEPKEAPPEYICPYCGDSFDNAQALGGHKGRCKKKVVG